MRWTAFACVPPLSDTPVGPQGFADSLAAGLRGRGRRRESDELTLAHHKRWSIREAFDLVLRLAIMQLRQEPGDFVDASRALVLKLINRALNRVYTDTSLNANEITNTVTVLSH